MRVFACQVGPPLKPEAQAKESLDLRWRVRLQSVLLVVLTGCSTPQAQLSLVEQDKQQLLATIKDQRETIRSLRADGASKETRLAEAEKELARLPGGTRISTRPADSPPVKSEPLPWRSPPAKAGAPAGTKTGATARRLDAQIAFAEGQAVLSGDAKRQLDGIASLLKQDEHRDLRVMVAGYAEGRPASAVAEDREKYTSSRQLAAARAQAVADYLDRHGIAQERLGVSGLGSRGPIGGSGTDRLAASGSVQIYLLEPDATVVGWGTTGEAIRR
jgi:outer membrane protein OmpA-like peptidoglycan-associated protein